MLLLQAQIKNGSMKIDRESMVSWILAQPDGEYVLEIKRQRKSISLNQHRYYRGVIVPMVGEFIGEVDLDHVHGMLAYKFLRVWRGHHVIRVKSTAELSTVEAEEYYMRIRTWMATEYALAIPLPNESPFPYDIPSKEIEK